MRKSLFKKVRAPLKDLPRYIPERLHRAVHYFVTISWNSQLFLQYSFIGLLSIRNSWDNNLWNTIWHQIQDYTQHHIQHHIRKYKNNSILVPFWAIIDHKNVFTQDTLHTSFISQKNLRSPSQTLLQTSTFYCIFNSFRSG